MKKLFIFSILTICGCSSPEVSEMKRSCDKPMTCQTAMPASGNPEPTMSEQMRPRGLTKVCQMEGDECVCQCAPN